MSRQTNAQLKGRDGSEVLVQDSHTDAPLLPIAGLERLHKIRPDRVDWVFDQTEIEASTRRTEQKRVNTLVFIERMAARFQRIGASLQRACDEYDQHHNAFFSAASVTALPTDCSSRGLSSSATFCAMNCPGRGATTQPEDFSLMVRKVK